MSLESSEPDHLSAKLIEEMSNRKLTNPILDNILKEIEIASLDIVHADAKEKIFSKAFSVIRESDKHKISPEDEASILNKIERIVEIKKNYNYRILVSLYGYYDEHSMTERSNQLLLNNPKFATEKAERELKYSDRSKAKSLTGRNLSPKIAIRERVFKSARDIHEKAIGKDGFATQYLMTDIGGN